MQVLWRDGCAEDLIGILQLKVRELHAVLSQDEVLSSFAFLQGVKRRQQQDLIQRLNLPYRSVSSPQSAAAALRSTIGEVQKLCWTLLFRTQCWIHYFLPSEFC